MLCFNHIRLEIGKHSLQKSSLAHGDVHIYDTNPNLCQHFLSTESRGPNRIMK
jgi:hypothetical protein